MTNASYYPVAVPALRFPRPPSPRSSRFTAFAVLWLAVSGLPAPVLAQDGDAAWDVEATGQPEREVSFTLEEGTWMSVDVSPDGQTLVFDLLGDIYTLPASGGEATALTRGPAMDRTPTFSPDGGEILYLSDRSGDDNVWVMGADGGQARRITDETAYMLANPEWSADGRYIAAAAVEPTFENQAKSEIRLYHRDGGAGRTLVDIPENQRDVQEAEFSPDGRYLYYTQRMKDHGIYVDANHANYAIRRRDLRSGETIEVAGGFGSALTPQVSADGRRLAFVRRVRAKTVLFVHDLETGEQLPVYDDLARDQQADFYQQGVYYPGYDWFPDNRHVAIWGKGRLFRIDTDTGEATEIPFRLTSTHRIVETPRFADPLAPDEVTVRTARQLALAPDGERLLFHALGHLWKRTLPTGIPERLTGATAFEFDPAFSADGRRIAYIEWDDETGSALIVARSDGRGRRVVVRSSGVLRQPAFSPDGETLVYAIGEPSKIMGGYRARPGLYTIPADGGEPTRIGETADSPRFSADGSRILFTRRADGDTTLSSVNRQGFDARDHAVTRGHDRSELALSPDGAWVTFKENQQYFLAPYRETGRLTEVSSTGGAVPVRQLTAASGYNLVWVADSARVWWTLGPALHRADATLAAETSGEPVGDIGLTVPGDRPDSRVAFVGGRVITMRGDEVIADGTVIVEGNRIAAVGPSDEVAVPADAFVVDATGKTVMPGLVDMHGHIDCCYYGGPMPQKHPSQYAAAAHGVTTNFDPYTSELNAYATTEMQQAGFLVAPRFIASGRVVYGRAGKPDRTYVPLDDYEDAANTMRRKRALGGRVVKSYKQPSRRARQQLVKAGREAGVMIDAEGESHFYLSLGALLDGHMALEHMLPVATYYDDIVQLMAHSGAANTPTLNVTFGEIMGENHLYQTTRAWENPKVRTFVQEVTSYYSPVGSPGGAPPHVRAMTTLHAADEIWDIGFRSVSRSMKRLDEAGALINAGSHGQVYGLAMHWEMWSLGQGGMAPHRILRTATINGAKTLGLDDQIGSLEPGKLADVIVLDENPLEDIQHSDSVRYTMINGRLYDSYSMDEIGPHDRPRTRFYWELPDYHGIDWNEAWSGQ